MFVRPKGARNANDMSTGDFSWLSTVTCLDGGGGVGADCNGYPQSGFRYDSPTFGGFSVSSGFYEDHVWDVAVKYAADWNNFKVSAAFGFDQNTDEGCNSPALANNVSSTVACTGLTNAGGGGAPFQGYRKEVDTAQVGASVMHVPSGLFVYGLYQNEQNNGTQWLTPTFNSAHAFIGNTNSNANDTNVWFLKAGIKRTWTPLGATVIWGEGGQYDNQFGGICSGAGAVTLPGANPTCAVTIASGSTFSNGQNFTNNVNITGSTVNRYGVGIVQEIDAAAMHVFARWQHLNLDLNAVCQSGNVCLSGNNTWVGPGGKVNSNFSDLDIFQVGGVIFF